MDWLALDPLLRDALQEDVGRGDLTTEAILYGRPGAEAVASARILAKEELVLAGWPVFVRVFELLGSVESEAGYAEGVPVGRGLLGVLRADPGVLLKGERVALNLLQRLCGIASETRLCVELVAHTKARIVDTRKTTPLWRVLEKYAVRAGGGHNHRMGLDDGVLIKENHIALAGGLRQAIEACRRKTRHLLKLEVEVRSLDELRQALECGVDAILLDNLSVEEVRTAVRLTCERCLLEVSGGITRSNLVAYAETGVDLISLGALTHSARARDISMLVDA
jgi:nicotinate-nucleotide pyrophosphorylase (carboxylating)